LITGIVIDNFVLNIFLYSGKKIKLADCYMTYGLRDGVKHNNLRAADRQRGNPAEADALVYYMDSLSDIILYLKIVSG
jgi:hypothetical protein